MAYNMLETLQTTPCPSQQCNGACPRQGVQDKAGYGVFKWKAKFIFLFLFLYIFQQTIANNPTLPEGLDSGENKTSLFPLELTFSVYFLYRFKH